MGKNAKENGWDKVQIGSREYCFEDVPGEEGAFLSMKIMASLGPAFCGLLGESTGDPIAAAIAALAGNIDPKANMEIFRALIPRVFINECGSGKRATFDDFQGRTMELFKVMFFCMRYNFADFFDAAPLLGAKLPGANHA